MRFWRPVLCVLILIASSLAYSRLPGGRSVEVFAVDPPTPYFHYTPVGTSRGQILVVHGLSASKHVMNILSFALAEAGFEVFAIDLPGHGDSATPFNGVKAKEAIEQVLDRLGPGTLVIGHSFGAALLLDISQDRPFRKMVLFSPAPIPIEHIQAEDLLVLDGQFDPAAIRIFSDQIEQKTTGRVELRKLAWTGHSGGLVRPDVIAYVLRWLGATGAASTSLRLALILLMMFSGIAALGTSLSIVPSVPDQPQAPSSLSQAVLGYTFAAILAASVLATVNLVFWIRIFAMDYLIGFTFLVGLFILFKFQPQGTTSLRHVTIALLAALLLIGLASWRGTEVAHATMSDGRWWRFAAMTGVGLPFFIADETLLRPLRSAWAAAIITRLVVIAVVISGVLILDRESAFVVLLSPLVFLFWMALWLASGRIRTKTDPFAAGLFSAIVQAWMFSTLFVIT